MSDVEKGLVLSGSRLFAKWLTDANASLVFTTYQAGKLFLVGMQPDGNLSIFERTFDRCMGVAARDTSLWLAARNQLWRFEDFLGGDARYQNFDAHYVPVTGHTTGDVDIHDVHIGADGRPLFCVTRFNAVATLADRGSFKIVWMPPFIDRVAAEDRCHLNGMAMDGDELAYVTCVGRSNVSDGWRDHRVNGGLLIDARSNEILADDLSMPHSPRLHNGKLWLIQSGTGELGHIDVATGKFEPVCFLPGFARGFSIIGDHAVIGLSLPRDNRSFNDLPLNARLEKEGTAAKCAVCVVNLKTGDLEHQLLLDGVVKELYDVVVIPNKIRPMALGFSNDEISFAIRPEVADGVVV